jgi:hypothetical protein
VDDISWIDILMARIPVLVLVLVLLVVPIAFAGGFGGVTLDGLLHVNTFEDTTFFHCVVGLRMELAWSFQGFVVVLLIVATTSESFDRVDLMIVVTGSFTPEFITVVTTPISSFLEVPIIIVARSATVKPPAVVAIVVSPGRVVILLTSSDVFSDQFLHVVSVDVIFGSSKELDNHAWPLTK